jgi:hypothetical protein
MLKQFENLMVTHLKKFFPKKCAKLEEDGLRKTIRYGIEQAKFYGIVIENDVSLYLNLMFTFGKDFDKTYPWASKILKNENYGGPRQRTKHLYKEAGNHVPTEIDNNEKI